MSANAAHCWAAFDHSWALCIVCGIVREADAATADEACAGLGSSELGFFLGKNSGLEMTDIEWEEARRRAVLTAFQTGRPVFALPRSALPRVTVKVDRWARLWNWVQRRAS